MRFNPGIPARRLALRALLALIAVAGQTSVANAQTYLIDVSNVGDAVVIEQAKPGYPRGLVPVGQDGWVRMHFVITANGVAVDPIIIDSSGGTPFEAEATQSARTWRFAPAAPDAELPNNLVNIRTRIRRGMNTPGLDFMRVYNSIIKKISAERIDAARDKVDQVQGKGGWNLYESTLLWMLNGRLAASAAGKLEAYQRALSISTQRSLSNKDRLQLLGKIFMLQDEAGHFAAALRTFARLNRIDESSEVAAELAPRAAEIEALLSSDAALAARATIYNPCNCEAGQALWYYRPARRTFSFANLNGNVERFEARCDNHRIRDAVTAGKSWTLAPEWGNCRVFVFGDDGSSFDFVEQPIEADKQNADEAAVARNHVLDRRN